MKKYLFLLLVTVSLGAVAQEVAVTAAPNTSDMLIEFNGGKYPGHIIEFNTTPELVEEAVKDQFNSQGVKPKSIKDFLVYRSVRIPSIDPVNVVDAFIKVERKSRKEKDQTIVYLITTKPGEISDNKVKSDGTASAVGTATYAGGTFLQALHPSVEIKKHNKQVQDKEEEIAKAEKKMRNLLDDQSSLEKKIKQYQKDLEDNKKAQEAQTAELANQRKALEELQAKKPGGR